MVLTTITFILKCFNLLQNDLAASKESTEKKEAECQQVSSRLEEQVKAETELQQEIDTLKAELTRLREAEDILQSKVASRDRKLNHLEEKITELQESRSKRSDSVS